MGHQRISGGPVFGPYRSTSVSLGCSTGARGWDGGGCHGYRILVSRCLRIVFRFRVRFVYGNVHGRSVARTENNQRGRALGWVMSGQSLTLLIGVPLAAWLGALVGWRGVHLAIAGLAVFSSVCVFIAIRRYREQRSTSTEKKAVVPLLEALSGPLVRLFAALVVERVCFGLSTFYYPAYLRTAYDLEIDEVALPLLVFAVGNIAGTIIGGYVADKFPYRRINFAVMLLASGGFALPLVLLAAWIGCDHHARCDVFGLQCVRTAIIAGGYGRCSRKGARSCDGAQ